MSNARYFAPEFNRPTNVTPKLTIVPELVEKNEAETKFDQFIDKFIEFALTKSLPYIIAIAAIGGLAIAIRVILQKVIGI